MADSTFFMGTELPLCKCGCGRSTGFYPRTRNTMGIRKGDPIPFAKGHQHRAVLCDDVDGTKTCSKCKRNQPIEAFDLNKRWGENY